MYQVQDKNACLEQGKRLKKRLNEGGAIAFLGAYDVFSAKLIAKQFEGIFCSGFSFTASFYGLPDIGYMSWKDIADFAIRIKNVLPNKFILVDGEDGFGDEIVAATVIKYLETANLSAVILEDQKRPKKCGHFDNKKVLSKAEFIRKLKHVLSVRKDIFVLARTDAVNSKEGVARAVEYAKCGADGIMIEAVQDLGVIKTLVRNVDCPIAVNQLNGGKTPSWSLKQLEDIGVSIVLYSTIGLFASQYAIQQYLNRFKAAQRITLGNAVNMAQCNKVLYENI